jgi:hypothetical protein
MGSAFIQQKINKNLKNYGASPTATTKILSSVTFEKAYHPEGIK